jgi:predicted  nucleic acid-binding Zn-ribbon protein
MINIEDRLPVQISIREIDNALHQAKTEYEEIKSDFNELRVQMATLEGKIIAYEWILGMAADDDNDWQVVSDMPIVVKQ